MAECQRVCPIRDLKKVVNGNEILAAVHFTYPRAVVITHNQPLLPVKPLQDRFRLLAAEKQIADDTDGITVLNPAVPIFDDGFVHFLYLLKRTVAKSQDISMPEMGVRYEIKHSITSHFFE